MRVLEKIRLQLKGMGLMALVPVAGCLLLLPFGTWLLNRDITDAETRYLMASEVSYQFMPLFSVFIKTMRVWAIWAPSASFSMMNLATGQ